VFWSLTRFVPTTTHRGVERPNIHHKHSDMTSLLIKFYFSAFQHHGRNYSSYTLSLHSKIHRRTESNSSNYCNSCIVGIVTIRSSSTPPPAPRIIALRSIGWEDKTAAIIGAIAPLQRPLLVHLFTPTHRTVDLSLSYSTVSLTLSQTLYQWHCITTN
jgi:hypothetical protein